MDTHFGPMAKVGSISSRHNVCHAHSHPVRAPMEARTRPVWLAPLVRASHSLRYLPSKQAYRSLSVGTLRGSAQWPPRDHGSTHGSPCMAGVAAVIHGRALGFHRVTQNAHVHGSARWSPFAQRIPQLGLFVREQGEGTRESRSGFSVPWKRTFAMDARIWHTRDWCSYTGHGCDTWNILVFAFPTKRRSRCDRTQSGCPWTRTSTLFGGSTQTLVFVSGPC